MTLDEVQAFALSLPGVTEAPHHDRTSFRVNGKIFATAPPDGGSVNIFVGPDSAEAAVSMSPGSVELLWWGKRMVGVRVSLADAEPEMVRELLVEAWALRANREQAAEATALIHPKQREDVVL